MKSNLKSNGWFKFEKLISVKFFFSKLAVCEKFASKNPSVVAYDEKFLQYYKTIEEIQALVKSKDIEFVRLSQRSALDSIIHHSKDWMKCLGHQLNETCKKSLYDLKHRIDKYESDLKHETDTLDDLKFVLRNISDIQQASDTVETTIREIAEKYRTLDMYKIDVTHEEKEILMHIEPQWHSLFMTSKHRDVGLTIIKERFTEITQDQISDFGSKLKSFAEKFAMNGPGSVGEDLDLGIKILKVFKDELTKLEYEKQELTNAERLFNLPISSYTALVHVQKEMRGLDEIYKLFDEQKVFSSIFFIRDFYSKLKNYSLLSRNLVKNGQKHSGAI